MQIFANSAMLGKGRRIYCGLRQITISLNVQINKLSLTHLSYSNVEKQRKINLGFTFGNVNLPTRETNRQYYKWVREEQKGKASWFIGKKTKKTPKKG